MDNFRTQISESKCAKLHRISAARVDQAIDRMQATFSASSSGINVLSVSGSPKLYVKMADSQEASTAEHGKAPPSQLQKGADLRPSAVPEQ